MGRSGLYVKLDTNFPDDDKIEAVGLAGSGLYAQALCMAKRLNSEGRIARTKLRKLGADDSLIDLLVAEELFTADGQHVLITAWLAHNPSTDAIEAKRAEDAARKRLTRAKRPVGRADTKSSGPTGSADLVEEEEEEEEEAKEQEEDGRRSAPRRATGAPDLFPVTEAMVAWAAKEGIREDALRAETDSFLDWHRAKNNRHKDWVAAWRTWMRRAKEFRPQITQSSKASALGPQETYR